MNKKADYKQDKHLLFSAIVEYNKLNAWIKSAEKIQRRCS